MPGVLIIEAMAQVGGVLARLSVPGALEEGKEDAIFFMSMDKVKFRKPVVPGDRIVFELVPLRRSVDGEIVAEAELVASIG